jgi:hypothetical protein
MSGGLPRVWGATADEVRAHYPCDEHLDGADDAWFRAVTVEAGRETVFRWLCQLKVAPYSYDLLDNGGRRSPRTLTQGAERLERGQRVMTIFRLVDFSQGEHLTMLLDSPRGVRLFGRIALSYVVRELSPESCRLVVKLVVGSADTARRRLLPWGDVVMMRRQLLTLKRLAERERTASL